MFCNINNQVSNQVKLQKTYVQIFLQDLMFKNFFGNRLTGEEFIGRNIAKKEIPSLSLVSKDLVSFKRKNIEFNSKSNQVE